MNERELERALQGALARHDPPLGFADRVMARLREPRPVPRWRFALLAVAATLLVGFGAGRYHQYRKAVQAREQLTLALRITAVKIGYVYQKVQEHTRSLPQ